MIRPLLSRRPTSSAHRAAFATTRKEAASKGPRNEPKKLSNIRVAVDPGSVQLPPRPPAWQMALRMGKIGLELGSMKLRQVRGVSVGIRARKMRETFIRLGPAFVKAGQALATRPDVGFPPEVCAELAKLQDQMPPFPTSEARKTIEAELGFPIHELFDELSSEPVAAASLGQVYRGKLKGSGVEVAVKVQRPGLESIVTMDAHVFRTCASVLQAAFPTNSNLVAVTDQLVGRVVEEIDFRVEASFATRFGDLYRSHEVAVPEVFPHLCSRRVLTMEWIEGVPLAELSAATQKQKQQQQREGSSSNISGKRKESESPPNQKKQQKLASVGAMAAPRRSEASSEDAFSAATGAAGAGASTSASGATSAAGAGGGGGSLNGTRAAVRSLDPGPIIEVGVRCALDQLLEHGFYHGDPHPGNLMVTPDGKLAYLDFGMMGTLDKATRLDVVRLFVNFVNRDEKGLAFDLINLGFLPQDTPPLKVEEALKLVFQAPAADSGDEADGSSDDSSGESTKKKEEEQDDSSHDREKQPQQPQQQQQQQQQQQKQQRQQQQKPKLRRFDFRGVLLEMTSVMGQFQFQLPPHFALVIRALGAMEGTVIKVDPDFKVVARAYPHVVNQLLRDRSPEMRSILASLVVEQPSGKVRWSRLAKLLNPNSALLQDLEEGDDSFGGGGGGGGDGDDSGGSSSDDSGALNNCNGDENEGASAFSSSAGAAAASATDSLVEKASNDFASAADDAVAFLLSPQGRTVRRGLLQDGLDGVDSVAASVVTSANERERQQQHRDDGGGSSSGGGGGKQEGRGGSGDTSFFSGALSKAAAAAASLSAPNNASGSSGGNNTASMVSSMFRAAPGAWMGVASRLVSSPEAHRFAAEFAERSVERSSWRAAEWALAATGKALREDHRLWTRRQQKQERKQDRQDHEDQEQRGTVK